MVQRVCLLQYDQQCQRISNSQRMHQEENLQHRKIRPYYLFQILNTAKQNWNLKPTYDSMEARKGILHHQQFTQEIRVLHHQQNLTQ